MTMTPLPRHCVPKGKPTRTATEPVDTCGVRLTDRSEQNNYGTSNTNGHANTNDNG